MARVKRLDLTRAVMLWEMRFPPGEITPLERNLLDQHLASSGGLPRRFADELVIAGAALQAYADYVRKIEIR